MEEALIGAQPWFLEEDLEHFMGTDGEAKVGTL